MDKLKVGIIGIGNMGSAHLKCIAENEINGMTVVSACDIDSKKLDFIRSDYPDIKLFDNADDLIEKSGADAVIIAVPHPLHAEIGIKALRQGLHILCEKPVDISIKKAQALNTEAKKSGKIFGIMFNQRTNNLFQKAREIVKSGNLGELKRSVWIITNWYRTQQYYASGDWRATWSGEGGGVLINQCPHQLDLWQWICGMPESVTAFCDEGKYHDIEVEDDVTIYTRYENGATGVFITSTGEYPGTNRLEISGSLGKIVLENGLLKYWRLKEDERKVCADSKLGFCSIDSEYTEIKCEPEAGHKGILQNFTNAVLYGEELLAPGYDGINELIISNAAYLSQWQGNVKIDLPFDSDKFEEILQSKIDSSEKKSLTNAAAIHNGYIPRWQVRW